MPNFKYPLATSSWNELEYQAIQNVIASKNFTMGTKVKQFEKEFAKFMGSRFSIMVNSGSSANLLMIGALFYTKNNPLKIGDEVIVPAVSWSTTYYPLYQYGLKIKFVDIDLETLNYDLNALQNAISKKTKMILAVNLLGNSNDYSFINKLIDGTKIILIEDNCESMGAKYKGKMTGTFGKMASFSTFFSHHISTMEGGMVVTDDQELYHILLSLRAHGWTRNLPDENLVTIKSKNNFDESFRFVLPGYNLRPLEMSGAIGSIQLKKLPKFVIQRRKNANLFLNKMKKYEDLIVQKEIGLSSWFGFSIIIKDGSSRTREHLINQLNSLGFESRPIVAGNFANNEVVKYFKTEINDDLVNANLIDKNGLFIGNHHLDLKNAINSIQL